ncbi:vWA domain-containing protein [Streptomyces sp. NPDC002122]|uniref:vWA domain-containing protein n=1 Tax=Streptomyces sp. NPDC002122 TaxID=3154407 RepID=UPI003332EB72
MQWTNKGSALLLAGALVALTGPLAAAGTPGHPRTPRAPAAAAPSAAQPAAGTAADPADPAEGPDPIDFAVVVDQSASLADKDLARETEAAGLLSQGEISERSRATVIGFSSSEKAGQSPVREVCELTVADAAGRERLSACVQLLNKRDAARMGPGTDFPAAIRQAVTRLGQKRAGGAAAKAPATPKVVFLLTDGKLDVSDSPEYGTDAANRQSNGERRLTEELARARAAGVQIWPLGFGTEIDRAALTAMAERGYRGACSDVPGSVPHMRVVGSSAELDKALQETFAAARCARISHGTAGKPPADLTVVIPPIATDGSLTVSKHDPKVRVTYYDPAGRKVPTRGEFDGSTFEVGGQDGPVEALRVKNPLPGRWRVHIEAPEGHRDREVAVRAIWQGMLRSDVTLDPASPRAGEEVTVSVRMQTRRGVTVTDPRQLADLAVAAELRGDGFAPVTFRLADDGRAPDRKAGDVRFTGTLTVPAGATGDLELTTRMSAPGVTSDRRPLHARVTQGTPLVTAGVVLDRATVHPGSTVRGTLDVTNNDAGPRALRLAVENQTPGAELSVSPATVTAPPGGSTRIPFTVTVGGGTPLGELGGRIAAMDPGDGERVLDDAFLEVLVVAPPTWWDRWWKAVVGGAAVLVLIGVFLVIQIMVRRRRRDLTGVTIELRADGRDLDRLTIGRGQSTRGSFAFAIDDMGGAPPTLHRARNGGGHLLRRTGTGQMLLRPRGGTQISLRPGEPAGLDAYEIVVRGGATGRNGRSGRSRTGSGSGYGSGTGSGFGMDDGSGFDTDDEFGTGGGFGFGTSGGSGSGFGTGGDSGFGTGGDSDFRSGGGGTDSRTGDGSGSRTGDGSGSRTGDGSGSRTRTDREGRIPRPRRFGRSWRPGRSGGTTGNPTTTGTGTGTGRGTGNGSGDGSGLSTGTGGTTAGDPDLF